MNELLVVLRRMPNVCKISSHFFALGLCVHVTLSLFLILSNIARICPNTEMLKKIDTTLGTPSRYTPHSKQLMQCAILEEYMFVTALSNKIHLSYPQYLPTIMANIKAGMVQNRP